ncbi:cobaltochelatase subunit CobN [Carnimonas nigrificans]|uniref:cobaltochelatase subunit CobN n=1 Tax=Carnimonas nigrificans TaxID=64323 RepID=UPI00046EC7E9|nr:cobaltochelatase subunit CobN [Carnimonas nigrificans]
MHLFAAQPGGFSDNEGIIDLDQRPARIVVLSAADSVLSLLAHCADGLPDNYPALRLVNWLNLTKPAAFDLYAHKVLDSTSDEAPNGAEIVVLSLLGGASYWRYGLEQLRQWARGSGHQLVVVPGEDYADPELLTAGTVSEQQATLLWRLLREGGEHNANALFDWLQRAADGEPAALPCQPYVLPRSLLYHPRYGELTLKAYQREWQQHGRAHFPCVILTLYRSHLQAADTAMFEQLIERIEEQSLNVLPLAVASLKEAGCLKRLNQVLEESDAALVLNTTGFAISSGVNDNDAGLPEQPHPPLSRPVPVLQLILASTTREQWLAQPRGLMARDIAMQVSLPEIDGRIITRAVAFKQQAQHHTRSQMDSVRFSLDRERADFVARLANAWVRLAHTRNADKRIALVLANYPASDSRIGNGVGLDTPRSTLNILEWLKEDGYFLSDAAQCRVPASSDQLMAALRGTLNPAYAHLNEWLDIAEYQAVFATLPAANQQAVIERWGHPQQDPHFDRQRNSFRISALRFGNIVVGVQPARGFEIDQQALYHDPDLVPPHGYLAFYLWLRHHIGIDAVVDIGKHGNLEWLPGKGSALSCECWPDALLGPLPHLYPFIVNDPGEGAQAKRRSQAVIIDHLMPPMARAELYGDLAALEELADEYYQALGVDPRRETRLRSLIAARLRETDLIHELDAADNADEQTLLDCLDAWLCDIKEASIRDGLHVLGECPSCSELNETLVSLLRLPRGPKAQQAGILHALARDLGLPDDYDPLALNKGEWQGPKPSALAAMSDAPWATHGDTRERLELLALRLMEGLAEGVLATQPEITPEYPATAAVLESARQWLLPALRQSARQERSALLAALCGRYVAAGSSGAPTRGRWDVLPTGRNFYAVDSRAIPSKTAWALGQQAAEELLERYLQEHGDYPRTLGLSVWGTATMRTGGDDIAQAMALMGITPVWAEGSSRLVDYRIIPAFQLGRPRVDVTLRVSGLFRDAFPNVIALLDAAVRQLADYQEPGDGNPIRETVQAEAAEWQQHGLTEQQALRRASYRIFGARPGAYGSGVQGVLDNGAWQSKRDLGAAYVQWGGYAYGQDLDGSQQGQAEFAAFEARLGSLAVVLHNQDTREHDILDSADYSHFQGGMASASEALSGHAPTLYFGDHSNPATPRINTLKEEFNRVLRSRLLNPKWQQAMRQHGYKGAFEMAASIDNLFAFDATTGIVDDHQYRDVKRSLLDDPANADFFAAHNPGAQRDIAERLLEASQRGLWQADDAQRQELAELLLRLDASAEGAH